MKPSDISAGDIIKINKVAEDDWDKWLEGAIVKVEKLCLDKRSRYGFHAIIISLNDQFFDIREPGDPCYVMLRNGFEFDFINQGLFPWEEGYEYE